MKRDREASKKNLKLLALILLVMAAIYIPQFIGLPVWVSIVAAALVAGLSAFGIRDEPPTGSN